MANDYIDFQYETYQSFNWFDQFSEQEIDLSQYLVKNNKDFDFTLSNLQPVKTKIKNIFERSDILINFKDSSGAFTEYIMDEGDTPVTIAHKFYGSADLWWMILLVNKISDPLNQWPISQEQLNELINHLYSKEKKFSKMAYQRLLEDINNKRKNIMLPTKNTLSEIISLYRKNLS